MTARTNTSNGGDAAGPAGPIIVAQALRIGVAQKAAQLAIVDAATFSVAAGSTLGIVGESGSGKTMLCRSIIGTLSRCGVAILGGHLQVAGLDAVRATEKEWRAVRGRVVGYVPQSSLVGLNPILTVETQVMEALQVGQSLRGAEARLEAGRLLDLVQIPRAQEVLLERPHQLSGGMKQRVMIAAALALKPQMLVLDEPTTALDVTIQYEILVLLRQLRDELSMGMILVSHDLAVVGYMCERIMTMYAGAPVEIGRTEDMRARPRHPYTKALLQSRSGSADRQGELEAIPGEMPAVGAWPQGCRFWPRCAAATEACREGTQPGLAFLDTHETACLRAREVT